MKFHSDSDIQSKKKNTLLNQILRGWFPDPYDHYLFNFMIKKMCTATKNIQTQKNIICKKRPPLNLSAMLLMRSSKLKLFEMVWPKSLLRNSRDKVSHYECLIWYNRSSQILKWRSFWTDSLPNPFTRTQVSQSSILGLSLFLICINIFDIISYRLGFYAEDTVIYTGLNEKKKMQSSSD